MFDNPEAVPSSFPQVIKCLHCGQLCRLQDMQCPNCGEPLPTHPLSTQQILSALPAKHGERQGLVEFTKDNTAKLHVVGTPAVIDLPLEKPVILGRKILSDTEALLDLSEFNAFQQGVSRRHCQLQCQHSRLVVTDLGSSNGSILNNIRLLPFTNYVVAHNDHLVLGTLRLKVTFDHATE
jgi:hypothetical protein